MPRLENKKWEIFAGEIAKGTPIAEAYRNSGYKGTYERTTRNLLRNHKIQGRIAEFQKLAANRVQITVEGQLNKFEELYRKAFASGQLSAAVNALVAQSKLAGIWKEHQTVDITHQYVIRDRPMTEEEWAKERAETKFLDMNNQEVSEVEFQKLLAASERAREIASIPPEEDDSKDAEKS
jgi:hypothetical protein